MAAATLRVASFLGGAATVDVAYDDVTNVIASLTIVVSKGTLTVTLSGGVLPVPVTQAFIGTATFDLTGLGVTLAWVVSAVGDLSWPVQVACSLVGAS